MVLLKFNERIHIFLIGAIAFLLPVYHYIIPPLIVLLAINWLCAPKLIIPGFKNILKNPSIILMVCLYLLYLTGMLYTDNTRVGLETIETKLSFLIFPLVFSPYPQTFRANLDKYLKLFIYGSVVNVFACFMWAAYRFLKPVYVLIDGISYDLGPNYFYYTELSVFLHPSYIAMYSVFALIALIYLINKGELKLNWKWALIIFFLIIFILLLSSKAGWIGLFLVILYFFKSLVMKKRALIALLIAGSLIALFFFLNIYLTPTYSTRIPQLSVITQTLKDLKEGNKKAETSDGTRSRILVWKSATEIIKSNFWFGVGTGDAKDKMLEKYQEKGMIYEYENKLNAHNQFLNTFIAVGFVGFAVLFLCFLIPLFYSIKNKNVLFGGFIIIVSVNFLFEAMLETQAGVIFYAFFNALLCFGCFGADSQKKNQENLT